MSNSTSEILIALAPQFAHLEALERFGTPKPWTWDNEIKIQAEDNEFVEDELNTYYYLPECSWLTGAIMYGSDNDENGGIDAYFLEVATKQLRPLLDDYARVLQENEAIKAAFKQVLDENEIDYNVDALEYNY